MTDCDHKGMPYRVVWLRGRFYLVCGWCKTEIRDAVDDETLERMN